jgi:hypothetical protein
MPQEGLRQDQEQVEVRPGHFVWMNAADRKAWEKSQSGTQENLVTSGRATGDEGIESATVTPAETADLPRAKGRKAG